MRPRLVRREITLRASQQDSLNYMAKGTVPLTALLLKSRASLPYLFSMRNSDLLGLIGKSLVAKVPVRTWGGRVHMNKFCTMCDQKT